MKHVHIDYKKKNPRERTTRDYFSFDWLAECFNKYSRGIFIFQLDSEFTADIYWHYIGSQYFPCNILYSDINVSVELEHIKSNLNSSLRPVA